MRSNLSFPPELRRINITEEITGTVLLILFMMEMVSRRTVPMIILKPTNRERNKNVLKPERQRVETVGRTCCLCLFNTLSFAGQRKEGGEYGLGSLTAEVRGTWFVKYGIMNCQHI